MKENLKVKINSVEEREEAQNLFNSMGSRIFRGSQFEVVVAYELMKPFKEITLPELRELARPKEYLNDKFELVVTNQPDDGYQLVPNDADFYAFQCAENMPDDASFYKLVGLKMYFWMDNEWNISFSHEPKQLHKILWQRTPQQETIMQNKGRFLHQWAYEAFGRGEELEYTSTAWKGAERYADVGEYNTLNIFDVAEITFSLKPQTIQIGSRTINKPISVKPEIGTRFYIPALCLSQKYDVLTWANSKTDNLWLNRNLCHLTKQDAINMADALLELMK